MISLLIATSLLAAPLQDTAHVVLVATTDLHGHVTGHDDLANGPAPNGLARVARVADSLRAEYPGQVVLVDAGDLLEGNPFATYYARVAPREPHPIVEAMNLAGYDVATPGDHDFDWGVPLLRRAIGDARFAYVSANIFELPGDSLLLPAYRVVRRQGVRIGIAGFTTPGVMVWDRGQVTGKVRVGRIESAMARTLEAVRREADISVVLIHSGVDGRSSYADSVVGGENVAARLAGTTWRPDLVVVGHTHREMRDSVIDGVHFVQPRPFGASVSVVHISLARADGGPWRIRQVRADLVTTREVPPSDLLAQRLAPWAEPVAAWVGTPLGVATAPMGSSAARAQPTPIVNFVNDVQRARTGADLSATSVFDLHAGFDADTIRIGQMAALYPDENTLRAIRISGEQLKAYLEWSARYFEVDAAGRVSLNDSVPGYNYDIVGGARYDIDLRRPVGDRIQGLSVRGRPVEPADTFTMAINSYRQSGAGGYTMVVGAPVVYDKAESIQELLVDEVRRRGAIGPDDFAAADWHIVPEVYTIAVRTLFGIAPPPLPEAAHDTVVLRLLATADLRASMVDGAGPAAAAMDSLAAACGCASLRLDTGDAMQGTALAGETQGRAPVDVLGSMGYAAAALGPHDFDWGTDTLKARMADAGYPWLAANVFDSVTGKRPDWIVPSRVLRLAGMTIAVVGYVTPTVEAMLPDDRTRGLRFVEGPLPLHGALATVAAEHPALTVLLVHAGLACDTIVCAGEAMRLVEQLGGSAVGLVINGGGSGAANARVGGIPTVEPEPRGAGIAVIDLVKTPAGGLEARPRLVRVNPGARPGDAALQAKLRLYQRRGDSLGARPIARLRRPLPREGAQYALGGFLAEARRNAAHADVGLVRNDAIGADLPAGPVTYDRLEAVEAGGADIVAISLTGLQLRATLEQALDGGAPSAHIAGAQVRYDPRRPAGQRIRGVVLHGRREVKPKDRYTLATDAATADGVGGYVMLRDLPLLRTALLDVEADAALLRKLPQPVDVGGTAGFVSTRP